MPHIVTLVAARDATALHPATIQRVRDAVRGGTPLALSPGEAADIVCPGQPDMDAVRAALEGEAVDALAVHSRGRRKGLLVADMDSTIVTGETLDELAAIAGVGEQVAAITRRSMNGEIDFAAALHERVALLRGLELAALERTWAGVRLTPGALVLVATMRAHNATAALVSGGFSFFTGRVAALCGFDVHRANTLVDDGAALTGAVGEPVLDRDAKLAVLQELAAARGLKLGATLAVGMGRTTWRWWRRRGWGWRSTPSRWWRRRRGSGWTMRICGRCCSRRGIRRARSWGSKRGWGVAPNSSRGRSSSAHLSRGQGDDHPLAGAGQSPAAKGPRSLA